MFSTSPVRNGKASVTSHTCESARFVFEQLYMDLAHLDMNVAHNGIEAPGAPWEDNPCCYCEH